MVAKVLWIVTRVLLCGCYGTWSGCYDVARLTGVVARVLLCVC